MKTFEYEAVLVRQTATSSQIVLFGAPASEIDTWGGVPQKRQLGRDFSDTETVGFQRELNARRLTDLTTFNSDPANVIQNPLLCAARLGEGGSVRFEPHGVPKAPVAAGRWIITGVDLDRCSLTELLGMVREQLERRVPELSGRIVDEVRLATLRQSAASAIGRDDWAEQPAGDADTTDTSENGAGDVEDVAAVIEDESHIVDFWQEVAAREVLLRELDSFDGDEFLGYSRAVLIPFLCPVVIVDGQHRLEGALAATRKLLEQDETCQADVERLINGGACSAGSSLRSNDTGSTRYGSRGTPTSARRPRACLPVRCRQPKATPIGRALLGTIVSTTLSNEELRGVSDRLSLAGIPLEDSRAIASLTRDPASPFVNRVERGLTTEGQHLLGWPVFGGLVRIFRDLQGGKLFGQRNDYANRWQRLYLASSALVSDSSARGFDSDYVMWHDLAGPWRNVFIKFWTAIRDAFATTTDPEANNYWGGR